VPLSAKMKLPSWCTWLALAALFARAASKEKSLDVETSNVSKSLDSGELPLSLETLETALLALAQKRNTPGVEGTITQVTTMIANMKAMVKNQTTMAQQTANEAWADLLTCKGLYDPAGKIALQSVDSLAKDHATCRIVESGLKVDYELCKTAIAKVHAELERESAEFKAVNVFPRPGFCTHHADAFEYSSVRAYMLHFRNTYSGLLHQWEKTFNDTTGGSSEFTQEKLDCYGGDLRADGQGGKEGAYRVQNSECDAIQTKLEEAACYSGGHKESCEAFTACYQPKHEAYFGEGKIRQTAVAQFAQAKSEYHAIVRIACVLDSFTEEGEDAQLNDLIEGCRRNSRVDPGFLQFKPPEESQSIEDHTDCMVVKVEDLPGSAAFTMKMYETLITPGGETVWASVKDEVLACKGRCCQEVVETSV